MPPWRSFVLLALSGLAAPLRAAPTPGARPVGFTQRWLLDSTRTYRYADSSGRVLFAGARPLLLNVWYPAARGGAPMPNGDYFTGAERTGRRVPGLAAWRPRS